MNIIAVLYYLFERQLVDAIHLGNIQSKADQCAVGYYRKGLSAILPKFILGRIPILISYCISNLQA